jgi:cell division protein ZapA
MAGLRRELNGVQAEKDRLEAQVERLLSDRDAMRLKVEAMLDAIAVLEMEAEVMRKYDAKFMEATTPQKVKVQIYNETYTLIAQDGDPTHIQELAALVDRRMREIGAGGRTVDSRKIAILAYRRRADQDEGRARPSGSETGRTKRRVRRSARSDPQGQILIPPPSLDPKPDLRMHRAYHSISPIWISRQPY